MLSHFQVGDRSILMVRACWVEERSATTSGMRVKRLMGVASRSSLEAQEALAARTAASVEESEPMGTTATPMILSTRAAEDRGPARRASADLEEDGSGSTLTDV